ncbi:hypothetical protein JCM17380_33730 [Desulfosporosinus burensis]
MAFSTILQIFCRYILNSALTWPEELNIFLMAWITFTGSSIALRNKQHIGIEMFINMLPKRLIWFINLLIQIIMLVIVLLIIKYGYNVAALNLGVTSDALGISMFIPRFSLVLGGVLMLVQIINLIMRDLRVIFVKEERSWFHG